MQEVERIQNDGGEIRHTPGGVQQSIEGFCGRQPPRRVVAHQPHVLTKANLDVDHAVESIQFLGAQFLPHPMRTLPDRFLRIFAEQHQRPAAHARRKRRPEQRPARGQRRRQLQAHGGLARAARPTEHKGATHEHHVPEGPFQFRRRLASIAGRGVRSLSVEPKQEVPGIALAGQKLTPRFLHAIGAAEIVPVGRFARRIGERRKQGHRIHRPGALLSGLTPGILVLPAIIVPANDKGVAGVGLSPCLRRWKQVPGIKGNYCRPPRRHVYARRSGVAFADGDLPRAGDSEEPALLRPAKKKTLFSVGINFLQGTQRSLCVTHRY